MDKDQLETIINMVRHYDLVIVQRVYLLHIVLKLKTACQILGKPLIFETDDDYLSIIPSNPAYFAIIADQDLFTKFSRLQFDASQAGKEGRIQEADDLIKKANEMLPLLMESRAAGERDYIEILKLCDGVTTSTQELANTIYPYNKNIGVFRNNVKQVNPWRLQAPESAFITENEKGERFVDTDAQARFGIHTKPSYAVVKDPSGRQMIKRTPRVGYTCTASHFGEDWNTISGGLNEVAEKFENGKQGIHPWWIYFEDKENQYNPPIFSGTQLYDRARLQFIPPSGYDIYMANISNLDIGLAPLYHNSFNLSKSDIKAVEYASWGVCPLLPNIKTYTRSFIDNKTCLTYNNEQEFAEKLELLLRSPSLREEIGRNALEYVYSERLAFLDCNTVPRYEFYKKVLQEAHPLKIWRRQ